MPTTKFDPIYQKWVSMGWRPKHIKGWVNLEAAERHDLITLQRAETEVRLARAEHKINEIGIMVAAMYQSMGMSGQLPSQIQEAQSPQRRRPVGFGQ